METIYGRLFYITPDVREAWYSMESARILTITLIALSISLFAFGLYELANAAYGESFLGFVCYTFVLSVVVFRPTDEN